MHIGGGLSLEQTVARARQRGLAQLNAMALHKRLCNAGTGSRHSPNMSSTGWGRM